MGLRKRYQLEAALRPIVEFHSAALAGLTALTAWLFQYYLLMPPIIAAAVCTALTGYALWRLNDAFTLWHYQRHLTRLPRYVLSPARIPVSDQTLFLGKGFQWQQKHTQRLRDLLLPKNEHYLQESRREQWGQQARRVLLRSGRLPRLARWLAVDSRFNPLRPKPPVGGLPALHAVGLLEAERPVEIPLGERVGHTLVLGTTRVGKTRLAEILINQDIRRGETVIVFDPKGDSELLRSMWVAADLAGRLDHFIVFHLAYPQWSARYNPIGAYSRITEVATRVTSALPGAGNSAAFKEFGWRFTNIIAQALHALGEKPTFENLLLHVSNIEALLKRYGQHYVSVHGIDRVPQRIDRVIRALTASPEAKKANPELGDVKPRRKEEQGKSVEMVAWARLLEEHMNEVDVADPVARGLLTAFYYDRTYFDKIVSSLGPFLEKLTTGQVAELFSPDYLDALDPRPLFDWYDVIRQQRIVYVGLAALQDVTVASAVGAAMFSDLTSVAGRLYAYGDETPGATGTRKIALHADEFNELIGPDFIPMLNKAGGAGFQVTAYTQTMADIEARLGDRAQAEQVLGNLNNMIVLRVLKEETAKVLTDRLPDVQVQEILRVSGGAHSSDPESKTHFTSSVQDRIGTSDVRMIQPSDLTRLPKGQCFALVEGSTLYKIRMPLPAPAGRTVPDDIAALTAHMKRDYQRLPANWAVDPVPIETPPALSEPGWPTDTASPAAPGAMEPAS